MRVINLVDAAGETTETLHSAYINDPNDGLYGALELDRGRAVLERAGLLRKQEGQLSVSDAARTIARLPVEDAVMTVVETLLLRERPGWVVAAGCGEARWEYVPEGVDTRLTDICPDPQRREAFLMALANKVDAEAMREVGNEGERYVAGACRDYLMRRGRPDLAERVAIVSEVSDQLGYDVVTPDLSGTSVRVEVKTQSGGGEPARVFLSRNEAEQGKRDKRWILMVCDRFAGGAVTVRGWCHYEAIAGALPHDGKGTPTGRWSSVELRLDRALLMSGLPLGLDQVGT